MNDWSRYCCDCEEIAFFVTEDVILAVEGYRCIECYFNNVDDEEEKIR